MYLRTLLRPITSIDLFLDFRCYCLYRTRSPSLPLVVPYSHDIESPSRYLPCPKIKVKYLFPHPRIKRSSSLPLDTTELLTKGFGTRHPTLFVSLSWFFPTYPSPHKVLPGPKPGVPLPGSFSVTTDTYDHTSRRTISE